MLDGKTECDSVDGVGIGDGDGASVGVYHVGDVAVVRDGRIEDGVCLGRYLTRGASENDLVLGFGLIVGQKARCATACIAHGVANGGDDVNADAAVVFADY